MKTQIEATIQKGETEGSFTDPVYLVRVEGFLTSSMMRAIKKSSDHRSVILEAFTRALAGKIEEYDP